MIIHVVLRGETINSIADLYGVSVTRIILENGLLEPYHLVVGQTIVITFPEQIYIVQEGDSLIDIANTYGVSELQLLRNNPYLSDREYIYPGDELVISYGNKTGKISTNGFANVFINRDILRKTLPYLTYLSIIGYRVTESAELTEIDDTELIQMAQSYHVAPLMTLSTLSAQGEENYEAAYRILNNNELMDQLINNTLRMLRTKGYYGLIITYQLLNSETLLNYISFTEKIVSRLRNEGFPVFIVLSPNKIFLEDVITFERVDYSTIGQQADLIMLLNYNWGYNLGPPAPMASLHSIKEFVDYVISQISPDKIDIGIPTIGYDWPLPYTIGITRATSLTLDAVLALARQFGVEIQFDERSQTPYFNYIDYEAGIPITHIVWFIDARSIDAILKLIIEYGLHGKGIWNIMQYYPQMWLILNSQSEIETILM